MTLLSPLLLFFFYFFVLLIPRFIFQPLTARWFSIGISISCALGHFLFLTLVNFDVIGTNKVGDEAIVLYFIGTWLFSLIPLNLIVLPFLYWRDKRLALKQSDKVVRIPENAFHALTFSGGYLGAWIGQTKFNHKVSKSSFQKKHYIVCLLSLATYIVAAYYYFIGG